MKHIKQPSSIGTQPDWQKVWAADTPALRKQWHKLDQPGADPAQWPEALQQRWQASVERLNARRANCPDLTFPEDLPVSARGDEIIAALLAHQVIIVCGETGSGKTTQLPKLCLKAGRGLRGLIGHTQPRRLAARATAARIAEELHSELGQAVGYKIRFTDRTQSNSYIKLMTDGILLAETQGDPQLLAYDTLIIDEAHERSLNIDFLLGYLKQLVRKRPDLKVIITSATLDAERFANHFAQNGVPAPVIEVSGRLYPIEMRWRPPGSPEWDVYTGIVDAVDEAHRQGPGDVLVFLPGEREIKEAAEALRKHHSALPGVKPEILPLFARQSAQEQQRVFSRSSGRRVVLATNVAETSLTVPGIRYVVDSGLARVKRYSPRNKVEQLQVEDVAQSAARQRAGRCGRVAAGVCFRLYDEAEFAKRPAHTDPEIVRSSLAGVILRMKSLGLGDVEDFPFLDAPSPRLIADGYQLLQELGAVNDDKQLTPLGKELAKLPLDPKIGRMILAARDAGCLTEVLAIASALSVQDMRERPEERAGTADAAHARFFATVEQGSALVTGHTKTNANTDSSQGARHTRDDGAASTAMRSEFVWYWNVWQAFAPVWKHETAAKQRTWCKQNFFNWMRMREWHDVHAQLHSLVAEHGWLEPGRSPPAKNDKKREGKGGQVDSELRNLPMPTTVNVEQIHCALLAGLLGNVACRIEDARAGEPPYLGARGIKLWPHPGSALAKKTPRWFMAAELVDTSRLFARCLAPVKPEWLERVGAHLIKRSCSDPHWSKQRGEAVAYERGVLYGLPVYVRRPVRYAPIDAAAARELMIRQGLVAGEWPEDAARQSKFLRHNQQLIEEIEHLEEKQRRKDVLVDEELIYAFYDATIPTEICEVRSFEKWRREIERTQPKLLYLDREQLMRHEAAGITTDRFPAVLNVLGQDFALSYRHEHGANDDGVTLTVPLALLNQVPEARLSWLVPGLLAEKVAALVKTVPQKIRHRLQPTANFIEQFCEQAPQLQRDGQSLLRALQIAVEEKVQLKLPLESFRPENLASHLLMNVRVVDAHGRVLGQSRSLVELRARLKGEAERAFSASLNTPAEQGRKLAQPTGKAALVALAASLAQQKSEQHSGNKNAVPAHEHQSAAPVPNAQAGSAKHVAREASQTYTDWQFGTLPELMEVSVQGRSVIGFPALQDEQTAVSVQVFDTPVRAQEVHAAGLRRLFALALSQQVKAIEKTAGLRELAMAYMSFGTEPELRQILIQASLQRACMLQPWPQNADEFANRVNEARPRILLIAQELVRLAGAVLGEHNALQKKLNGLKALVDVATDVRQQLAGLVSKEFLLLDWSRLQHLPRYLKGTALRLDKMRNNLERDAQSMREWKLLAQHWEREKLARARAGVEDPQLEEFRWLLEELRIQLYAQELKTPMPVSVKRLQKIWESRQR